MGRLVEALNRRKQEMRVQVEEGLLRSEIWLEVGRPDAAARVLEEQRQLVDRFRGEVESVLAAAAVEYEAERILRGVAVDVADDAVLASPGTARWIGPASTDGAPEMGEPPHQEPRRPLVAAAASAALSAVAAVAFVVMLVAPPEPAALEAAARAPLVHEVLPSAPDDEVADRVAAPPLVGMDVDPTDRGGSKQAAVEPGGRAGSDGIDLRGWLADQRDLLVRLGVEAPASDAVLRELEDLVTQLLPDGDVPVESAVGARVADRTPPDEPEAGTTGDDGRETEPRTTEDAETGAPPTKPAPEEPSPEPTERETSLFGDADTSPDPGGTDVEDGEPADRDDVDGGDGDGDDEEGTSDDASGTSDRSPPFHGAF